MVSTSTTDGVGAGEGAWRPRLVALDIDGTLLKWVEGVGTTYERISPPVYAAVHRALAAGAAVVLASGRSPHGMTNVADLLDLHTGDGEDEQLWVVASNGAVVFRYPPIEVIHDVTWLVPDRSSASWITPMSKMTMNTSMRRTIRRDSK